MSDICATFNIHFDVGDEDLSMNAFEESRNDERPSAQDHMDHLKIPTGPIT